MPFSQSLALECLRFRAGIVVIPPVLEPIFAGLNALSHCPSRHGVLKDLGGAGLGFGPRQVGVILQNPGALVVLVQ